MQLKEKSMPAKRQNPSLSGKIFFKINSAFIAAIFLFSTLPGLAQEVDLKLPSPSKIKAPSKAFNPCVVRAITVNPNDPFLFDFIIDKGDTNLEGDALEAETQKLVKYFLAALTVPDSELWVNLSPYEQDSMVPPALGVTELGKDLLVEDYYLKQVTAQLTNPNTPTGKKFWEKAYAKAQELYGNTKVPINTFSKVWVVPDHATVLEKDGSAFVAESHLKVYLDQDYLAVKKNLNNKEIGTDRIGSEKTQDINGFSADLIRELVLPEIEKEVNTGENFAAVRQIYNSAILAGWYKKRLKESLLGKLYADQNKVAGVNAVDMDAGDKIFDKYTAALKTGAYNIVKQDYDLSTQKVVQRKYFSGGIRASTAATTEIIKWQPGVAASSTLTGQGANPAWTNTALRKLTDASDAISEGRTQYVKASIRLVGSSSTVSNIVENRIAASSSNMSVPLGTARIQQNGRSSDETALLGSIKGPQNNNALAATDLILNNRDLMPSIAKKTGVSMLALVGVTPSAGGFASKNALGIHPALSDAIATIVNTSQSGPATLMAVEGIRAMPENVLRNYIASYTPAIQEAIQRIATTKPGESAISVVANGTNISVLEAPEVAGLRQEALRIVSQPVLTDQGLKDLALNDVMARTRMDLGRMGFSSDMIDQLEKEKERLRTQPSATLNTSIFILATIAKNPKDYLNNFAKIKDHSKAAVYYAAAKTAQEIIKARADKLPSATSARLINQGFDSRLVAEMEDVLGSKLATTLNTNPNPGDLSREVERSQPEVVRFFDAHPALAEAIINKEDSTTTPAQKANLQIAAVNNVLNMPLPVIRQALIKVYPQNTGNPQIDQENKLSRNALLDSINQFKVNQQSGRPLIASLQGSVFARQLAKPELVEAILTASASTITPLHESTAAVLLATPREQLPGLFAGVNISDREKIKIGEAMQAIARENPEILGNQSKLINTLFNKYDMPSIAENGAASIQQIRAISSRFDDRISALSAIPHVKESTLSNALTAAGVANSTEIAKNYVSFRSAQPQQAALGIIGLVKAGQTDMARTISNAASNPEFQKAIAADTNAVEQATPELTRNETELEARAGQVAAAYETASNGQKTKFIESYNSLNPTKPLTSPTVADFKIMLAKASYSPAEKPTAEQRRQQAPEMAALMKIPAVRTVVNNANVNANAKTASINFVQAVLAPNVSERTLIESIDRALPAKFKSDQKTAISSGFIIIKNIARDNPRLTEAIAGLNTVADLNSLISTTPELSQALTEVQKAAMDKLEDRDIKEVGGIDLSSESMELSIKRDGNGVVMPVSDQDLEKIKINGLAPVVLDVQNATPANASFLMNLSGSAPSK